MGGRRDELPRYTERPDVVVEYLRPEAHLPYSLTVDQVADAMRRVYDLLHTINTALVERGYSRLEDMLLGNTFAGILSELVVQSLALSTPDLAVNTLVGGFPDLLPTGMYPDNAVLRGREGIEVKSSKQPSGWQGHNPEEGWYMIFRYVIDTDTVPLTDRQPTEFVEVLAAKLEEDDWSSSGRRAGSRRTPTASIRAIGTYKLRSNRVYVHPGHFIAPRLPRGYKASPE